jgi:hypothetical protein
LWSARLFNCSKSTRKDIQILKEVSTLRIGALPFDEVEQVAEQAQEDWISNSYLNYIKEFVEAGKGMFMEQTREDRNWNFWRMLRQDTAQDMGDARANSRRATRSDYDKDVQRFPPFGISESGTNYFSASSRIFISTKGYIGIGPPDTRAKDTIHIFFGVNVPFILRVEQEKVFRSGTRIQHRVIGDCYVQGIMDGEALEHGGEENGTQIHLI